MDPHDSVDLLERMLAIESTSGEEGPLASFLVERMERLGFEAAIDGSGNAVGRRAGAGEPSLEVVLLGHMDTVCGRVPLRREGDRLYGRGAVDAKGPLATFVAAAAAAALRPGVRVTVVGAVEEEAATSRGARHVASRLRPDACIVGEPSGWDAVTLGYKGRLLVDYRAERPAGHSAGPEPSVADLAFAWWSALRAHADEFNCGRTREFDRLLCGLRKVTTASDGLTDVVEATAGFRLPIGFDTGALALLAESSAGPGARVRCYGEEPAFRSSRSTPIARPFLPAIRGLGGEPRFKVKTGTSDMNVVGPAWGCPVVAYGPGDSRLDHSPDEHIHIPEFLRAVDVVTQVLGDLSAPEGAFEGRAR